MPTQHTITLYTFEELPNQKAKDNARDWWRKIAINDDWYRVIEEDAEQVGIKINSFDTDRGNCCNIEFIDGAFNTVNLIKEKHGEECDTYKAALLYEKAKDALPEAKTEDEESRNAEAMDALETEFKKALERSYLKMLREELEYVESEEYIDETLKANEYTFLETGKRFEVRQ